MAFGLELKSAPYSCVSHMARRENGLFPVLSVGWDVFNDQTNIFICQIPVGLGMG